jgi:hypothetical protein
MVCLFSAPFSCYLPCFENCRYKLSPQQTLLAMPHLPTSFPGPSLPAPSSLFPDIARVAGNQTPTPRGISSLSE